MLNPIRLLAKCHYRKHFAFLILKGTKVYDTHHLLKFSIKTSYLRKSYTHVRILLLGWTQILDLNIKSYHILPRLGYGYGQSTEYLRYVILEDSLRTGKFSTIWSTSASQFPLTQINWSLIAFSISMTCFGA